MSYWGFLLIFLLLCLFQTCILSSHSPSPSPSPSPQLCRHEERDALLQLKKKHYHHLHPYSSYHPLKSWKPDNDCCYWNGITCDATTGHVVGLHLFNSSLSGSIHSNSTLFHLRHIRTLDLSSNAFDYFAPSGFDKLSRLNHLILSDNHFSGRIPSQISQLTDLVSLDLSDNKFGGQIPSEISSLTKLVSLDLSSNGFGGQIPSEISLLTNLVSLNLSYSCSSSQFEIPNLRAFVQNLSRLRELRLDGVNLSAQNNRDWCQHLSSALPNLRVLSMRSCSLTGPLDASISSLRFFSELYLSFNENLISTVPSSLVNLTSLTLLALSNCGFHGDFPSNVFLLPNLVEISLSDNPLLSVHLPEFPQHNSSLRALRVGGTTFQGNFPNSVGNLQFLEVLALDSCNFSGLIPPSLGNLTNLFWLNLSGNHFSGQIPTFFRERFPNLKLLNLEDNLLQGPIPSYLFFGPPLKFLDLSNNQFNGFDYYTMEEMNLSYDSFSTNRSHDNFVNTQMELLRISSCNISKFPDFLRNQRELTVLDLSSNRIDGTIPKWIWKKNLAYLNLSNNFLTGLDLPLPNDSSNIEILDLHSNMMQQEECPSKASCLPQTTFNHSTSKFASLILGILTSLLSQASFFSISNNNLTGKIPFSICNARNLNYLVLSNNQLSGTIPTCLGNSNLQVLDLQSNKLHGSIPPTIFTSDTCTLHTLKLNKNMLRGQVPRSLANCKDLVVLDIGDNQLKDTFPYWLENLSKLQILIMRSNNFGGPVGRFPLVDSPFPNLHVIDLSFNAFTGNLPLHYIRHWKAMMTIEDNSKLNYIGFGSYYRDTITIVDKGRYLEMQSIVTALMKTVDLSNNKFNGGIPAAMGNLKSLILLNLSGNSLTGQIPSSLGNLNQLEALDLSRNNLFGQIPIQLTNLTFLSILDLSDNNLTGRIPQGQQFDTFSNTSYEGNTGLCGVPLSENCGTDGALPPMSTLQLQEDSTCLLDFSSEETCLLDWKFVIAGYGSGLIVGVVIGRELFCRNNQYFACVLRIRGSKLRKRIKKKHRNREK